MTSEEKTVATWWRAYCAALQGRCSLGMVTPEEATTYAFETANKSLEHFLVMANATIEAGK
jgi:hypothetical protein